MIEVYITNILPTGTCFGVTKGDTVEAVFIPGAVCRDMNLQIGQKIKALLVPNAHRPDRTPWLATQIQIVIESNVEPIADHQPSVGERVQKVMRNGGVWTVATMFDELYPHAEKSTNVREYNAISTTLRSMFARGDCAKFQLWRSPDQSKPGREWFTCYPEKADVDEWVEAAE